MTIRKASGLVSLEGSGFYYNEVSGGLSGANLTLRALYEITTGGTQTAFVNLITHLTYDRVKSLISSGTSFTDAIKQAEGELRTALGIGSASFMPGKRGIELNILGGDTDANAYLFGVSAVVAQAGATKAAMGTGTVDATIQELLNTTAIDLADDGMISPTLTALYKQAQITVDPMDVTAKLAARLATIGSTATVPDLNRVLDSDGDGIVNASDNCPWVANPLQETITNQLCKATRFYGPQLKSPTGRILTSDLSLTGTDSIVSFDLSTAGTSAATGQIISFNAKTGFGKPTDFSLPMPTGVTGYPYDALSGDVTKDGAQDLLLLGSSWMAVYPANGVGGFGAPQALTNVPPDMVAGVPFQGFAVATVADFNGDGYNDIAGLSTNGKYLLQRQTAAGVWAVPTEVFPVAQPPNSGLTRVYTADFNKDGKRDLLFVQFGTIVGGSSGTVALGNGAGGFAALTPFMFGTIRQIGTQINSSVIADENGDGNLDFVFVTGSELIRMLGDGTGNFSAPSIIYTLPQSVPAVVGSFTPDLHPSLFLPSTNYTYFSLLNGGNAYKEQVTRIKQPIGLTGAAFDVNHDGILDLVGNDNGLFVTVFNK